jgi:hypothetical protein
MLKHPSIAYNRAIFNHQTLFIESFCGIFTNEKVQAAIYFARDIYPFIEGHQFLPTRSLLDILQDYVDRKMVFAEIDALSCRAEANAADASTRYAYLAAVTRSRLWAPPSHYASVAAWRALDHPKAPWLRNADRYSEKLSEYIVVARAFRSLTTATVPFDDLECKIIYLIDELQENIIVKHKNKFYLNLSGIEHCPQFGCKYQEEVIEKVLYGKDLFWWFCRKWLNWLYPCREKKC